MNAESVDQPAILGGVPSCSGGPPDWPLPDESVEQGLLAAVRSGAWGKYHGGYVERLEDELARYHRVEFALTCSSGTLAVELALRALRIDQGDEVILAGYDYPGNFRSVVALGAIPVLVNVDRDNWNLTIDAVASAMGPHTRAIIASHLHGGIVPIRELVEFARHRGIAVVEDAAQATGAMIEGRRAGTWGDVGTLSFGGSKLLTAGRGGCIITANQKIHHRARLASQRGNDVYPLSELQAAALLPQLEKLDDRNRTRATNVGRLVESITAVPGLVPLRNRVCDSQPSYYKLGFQFDPVSFGNLSRDYFIEAMRAEGVAMDAGFRGLHVGRSPSRYRRGGDLAEAERAHHGMVVLHHPVLLLEHSGIRQVSHAIAKIFTFRDQIGK